MIKEIVFNVIINVPLFMALLIILDNKINGGCIEYKVIEFEEIINAIYNNKWEKRFLIFISIVSVIFYYVLWCMK